MKILLFQASITRFGNHGLTGLGTRGNDQSQRLADRHAPSPAREGPSKYRLIESERQQKQKRSSIFVPDVG